MKRSAMHSFYILWIFVNNLKCKDNYPKLLHATAFEAEILNTLLGMENLKKAKK